MMVCVCTAWHRMAWHCIDLFIDPVVVLSYDDLSLSTGNIQDGNYTVLEWIHPYSSGHEPSINTYNHTDSHTYSIQYKYMRDRTCMTYNPYSTYNIQYIHTYECRTSTVHCTYRQSVQSVEYI